MKNLLYLLLPLFLFTACQKDYDNAAVPRNTNGGTTGATSNTYFPLTAGTTWSYRSVLSGDYSATVLPGDTTINGRKCSIVASSLGSRSYYYGQGNNISAAGQTFGNVVLPDWTIMKDGGVGTKWTNTANNQGTVSTFNSEVKALGLSRTVLNKQYSNVMLVEVKQMVTPPAVIGGPDMEVGTMQYYYAKGIGLVEGITTFGMAGLASFGDTTRLVSYTIK